MRADRLLSILMLLQGQGRMTARDLATELEVSERTIYRDMDALSAAGFPVYAVRGPGGGCSLLDEYRTQLTGLTRDELKALTMLGIPAPMAELGFGQQLSSALRKLSASLPDRHLQHTQRPGQLVHLDSTGWFETQTLVPLLSTIEQALWEGRKLSLRYRLPFETIVERLVDPCGLVAKAGIWHLVCALDGQIRVLGVSQMLEVTLLDEPVARPQDFDLTGFWKTWCREFEAKRPRYPVSVRIAPELLPYTAHYFGASASSIPKGSQSADEKGWVILNLTFDTLEDARWRILGCGGAVEVLHPAALRKSVQDFAQQIAALYEQ